MLLSQVCATSGATITARAITLKRCRYHRRASLLIRCGALVHWSPVSLATARCVSAPAVARQYKLFLVGAFMSGIDRARACRGRQTLVGVHYRLVASGCMFARRRTRAEVREVYPPAPAGQHRRAG